ncbi:hypothetical protein K7X08_005975 [Anisodus acutangulus]|uniref:Uncharacterized protein n=1 Tax=Anisodus acutangulus TaxID=402998 RepID=A0A9Q1R6V1_9SOLA|nr:hypothetical protein K7X08_005975 [Anisodus acutangulus]
MKRQLHTQNTGRSYGLVLLLAFGAAIFGVMTLHKLRDRHICNRFIPEKDRELDGLKLLLQEEREQAKEAKRQIEDMESDTHWHRTQKMDLDSRILEMTSTIFSLKEEQRTIEVALEDKQSEIKMLREKQMETKSDDSQVILLSETLRQKEAEIEDLKHRLEFSPVKMSSVSADDPSNPAVNFTPEAAGRRDDGRRGREELNESIKREDQKKSVEDIDNNSNESAHKKNKEVTRKGEDTGKAGDEQSQQLKTSQKDVPGCNTIFQINQGQRQNKNYTTDNASNENEDDKNQVQKQSNEVGAHDKGVTKGTSRVTKYHMRKTRRKRRQKIAKHQGDESGMHPEGHGIASMRNRKFLKVKMGTERIERIGGSKLETSDHQKDKDMDVDMRKKSDEEDYGIEMTKKIKKKSEDSALQINNQIRHAKTAEKDVRDDYLEVENDKETEEEEANMTGSAASLGEEGEDGVHNDEV